MSRLLSILILLAKMSAFLLLASMFLVFCMSIIGIFGYLLGEGFVSTFQYPVTFIVSFLATIFVFGVIVSED